jgi:hypothetical protein
MTISVPASSTMFSHFPFSTDHKVMTVSPNSVDPISCCPPPGRHFFPLLLLPVVLLMLMFHRLHSCSLTLFALVLLRTLKREKMMPVKFVSNNLLNKQILLPKTRHRGCKKPIFAESVCFLMFFCLFSRLP